MANIVEKYHLGKRLLELDIMIHQKYNLYERFYNNYGSNEIIGSFNNFKIPDDLLYYQSHDLMLERLNTRFREGILTKSDVDLAIISAQSFFNESIGVYTEEFWLKVSEEGLPVKRKKTDCLIS